ncbi:hypothetical protein [Hyalangium rubrum]|uniref:Uncharacterized protein n=1 Tax=Hyalangium rubrum TaxID=3103134 RepID=A0ABU5H1I6_9BACT|nr:hypothetical protein [Hyalangium sp. s54d21]MDY7226972.1 hypothetical protein [Hyalangium sp. s54d21]
MSSVIQNTESPVLACTLPPPELRRRRAEVLSAIRSKVQQIEETPEGFAFRFARTPALAEELAEFVRFESVCCAFLQMEVTEHGEDGLVLLMRGAPEAKALMRSLFVETTEGLPATTLPQAAPCGCDSGAPSCSPA